MDHVLYYVFLFFSNSSFLLMSALGMGIIFGMMNITNLAVGEFIMIGAYTTSIMVNYCGFPLPLAVLCAVLVSGLVGFAFDRLILCRLYNHILEAIVVTWGFSLIIRQLLRLVFGNSFLGVKIPFGQFQIGEYIYSTYSFVLILLAFLTIFLVFALFKFTRLGLNIRATMENKEIAGALGIKTNAINAFTFSLGCGLSGLCGALYAPTVSISPAMGNGFLTQAFVTVFVGGTDPIVGVLLASGVLGIVQSVFAINWGSVFGKISLLIVAILSARYMPNGFTSIVVGIKELSRRRRNKKTDE